MVKFLKKLFNIKTTRYFIVYYVALENQNRVIGNAFVTTYDINGFFIFEDIVEEIKKEYPSIDKFAMTGFNELSKDDYNQSLSKKTN